MKTRIGRKSLALIAITCCMTGCTRSETPATPGEAPAAAATPAAATAAATANADVIAPGIYTVCDVADTAKHGTLYGDHLSGKKVQIRPISAEQATTVCIGSDICPADLFDPQFDGKVLWMFGDQKRLQTVYPFEHDPGMKSVSHLVEIEKDPTDKIPESCKKTNVLILRICHPHPVPTPTAQWQCESSAGPHGTDAHIEN